MCFVLCCCAQLKAMQGGEGTATYAAPVRMQRIADAAEKDISQASQ